MATREKQPYAKLTRREVMKRLAKHITLSPMQRAWSTPSLRIALDTYEPEA